MKKNLVIGVMLACASATSMADDEKHGCGWGNLLFEGQSGLGPYVLASITNGTFSNALFGMTSGTNGCQTHHPIPYGGKSMMAAADFADEVIEDIAAGEGEALDALATMIGIEQTDRAYFNQLTHDNFATLVPSSEVTGEEVIEAIARLLAADERLSKYLQG